MGNFPSAPKPSEAQFDPVQFRDLADFADEASLPVTPQFTSSSFLYCTAQHTAEWPEYYVIVDIRSKQSYDKSHIPNSLWMGNLSETPSRLADDLHGMIVTVIDSQPMSPNLKVFFAAVARRSIGMSSLYVLDEPFSEFKEKYYFILSDFTATIGQLPGPIEYVPRTKVTPALYGLQRDRFPSCKTLVSYLGCTKVLNLSANRVSVPNTQSVMVENVCFTDNSEPFEQAVAALFNLAQPKKSVEWADSVLIVDDTGAQLSALLTGWYLVEYCGFEVDAVAKHIASKCADLDPWYMNTLHHWEQSRRLEDDGTEEERDDSGGADGGAASHPYIAAS